MIYKIKSYADYKNFEIDTLFHNSEVVSLDYETISLPYEENSEVIGVSLSFDGETGYYIIFKSIDYSMSSSDKEEIVSKLRFNLSKNIKIIVHNCVFELPYTLRLLNILIPEDRLIDTITLVKAEFLGKVSKFSLKYLAEVFLGVSKWNTDVQMLCDLFSSINELFEELNVSLYDFWSVLKNKKKLNKSESNLLQYLDQVSEIMIKSGVSSKIVEQIINNIHLGVEYYFYLIPEQIISTYGAYDSIYTYRLYELAKKKSYNFYAARVIQKQCYLAFVMEMNGVRWDKDYANLVKNTFVGLFKKYYLFIIDHPWFRKFYLEYFGNNDLDSINDKEQKMIQTVLFEDDKESEYFNKRLELNVDFDGLWKNFFNIDSNVIGRKFLSFLCLMSGLNKEVKSCDEESLLSLYKEYCSRKSIDISIPILEDNFNVQPDMLKLLISYRICRKVLKLLNTYLISYIKSVYETSWGVFPSRKKFKSIDNIPSESLLLRVSFQVCSAITGRWTSSNPTLHNLPFGSNIRQILISRYRGGIIAELDYSQVEIRMLAAISKDRQMIEDLEDDKRDFHQFMGSIIENKKFEDVTKDERRVAKGGTFGLIYGMLVETFAKEYCNGDLNKAQSTFNAIFERYFRMKEWIEEQHTNIKKGDPIICLCGRKIWVKVINGRIEDAFRKAQNYPIQGSSSDVVSLSGYKLHEYLMDNNFKSKLFANVHDAIYIDVHPDEIFRIHEFGSIMRKEAERLSGVKMKLDPELGAGMGEKLHLNKLDEKNKTICIEGHSEFVKRFVNKLREVFNVEYNIIGQKKNVDSYYNIFLKKRTVSLDTGKEFLTYQAEIKIL